MEKTKQHYSVAFKIKAVELSKHRNSIAVVAEELGVSAKNISRWQQEYDHGKFDLQAKIKRKNKEELEIAALRKQLKDTAIENEILKKALRIFTVTGK